MYFYYNKASSHKMLNHYNFPDIYQPKNNCCYYKCSPVYSYKHLLSKYIFRFLKHQIKTAVHKNGLRFYLVSFYSNSTKTNAFCLGIILCNVSRSFDYLIYPYYPAYTS